MAKQLELNAARQNKDKVDGGSKRRPQPPTVNEPADKRNNDHEDDELTVCDIIGEWGPYQWSLLCFGLLASALCCLPATVGPLWTPDIRFRCTDGLNATNGSLSFESMTESSSSLSVAKLKPANLSLMASLAECKHLDANTGSEVECSSFVYDDRRVGLMLTNQFDLVCSRRWTKSAVGSSNLVGFLLSSVSLGFVSDNYGRAVCIRVSLLISILATIGAILAPLYWMYLVCHSAMAFSLVAIANAVATLIVETTSPKYRCISVFQFGLGWGFGMMMLPVLSNLTRSYKHMLVIALFLQLVLALWFKLGVFESIRWLLSEGRINKAQIELQRACRWNGISNGAKLAHKIAQVQVKQVRRASDIIEDKLDALKEARKSSTDRRKSDALESDCRNLTAISSALRNSIGPNDRSDGQLQPASSLQASMRSNKSNASSLAEFKVLSPTLARNSFTLIPVARPIQAKASELTASEKPEANSEFDAKAIENLILANVAPEARNSLTTQGLVQLAIKYSKALQREESGGCFLSGLFHPNLYKLTLLIITINMLSETGYYGFVEANAIVGNSIELNYVTGAISEWTADIVFVVMSSLMSRKMALMTPVGLVSAACVGIALGYELMPIKGLELIETETRQQTLGQNVTVFEDTLIKNLNAQHEVNQMRETMNLYIMMVGKLAISLVALVNANVCMEAYPNNLRQTAFGITVIIGRILSIIAPFLFNDITDDKTMLKISLWSLASIGTLGFVLIPFNLKDYKDKELCEYLNDTKK